ncbi:choice-of-anchor D domain-containing protein [Haladaptatus pallidirubidus]|uniref:Uncharacterized protein n=1 Tax=Haladaptatus pallidirubidus TaxID=1008152 RepID=A0AAV3URN2_9EURY|nr:choice-of-anchor D domain-containing protein [Haladaptatus pallidirubidus]
MQRSEYEDDTSPKAESLTETLPRRSVLQGLGIMAAGLSATASQAAGQAQQQFNFGQTVVDSCSEAVTISVTNQNQEQSQTNAIEGPDADEFTILTGTTIPPGATQNVMILFTPTSAGAKQATIFGSVDGTRVSEATLVGVGVTLANASPDDVANFLEQPVGSQSTISVTPTYPASYPEAIEITGAQKAGQTPDAFEISNVPVGQVVQPGGTFEFDINFVPTSPGLKSANLVVEAQSLPSGFPYCALLGAQGLAIGSGGDLIAEVFDLNEEVLQIILEALELATQDGEYAEIRDLLVQAQPLVEQMLEILDALTGDDSPLTGERLEIIRNVAQQAEQVSNLLNQTIEFIEGFIGTASQSVGLLPTGSIPSMSNRFFSISEVAAQQEQDPREELVRLLEEIIAHAEEIESALRPLVCPEGLDVSFDFQDGAWVATSGDSQGLSVEGDETQATIRAMYPFTVDYTLESEDLTAVAELDEDTGEYCAAIGDGCSTICWFRVYCPENGGPGNNPNT